MQGQGHTIARSILKNSAALLVVGFISKAMGLVIAILIARFLGPDAVGLFAVLFSLAIVTENIATLGFQTLLIREVAAHPLRRRSLWRRAARVTATAGSLVGAGFLLAAFLNGENETIRKSLIFIAIGLPVTTVFNAGMAVLQGMERVLSLTWMIFVTRILSLTWLIWALMGGAGVEAAFISRLMFHGLALALFLFIILPRPQNEQVDGAPGLLRAAAPLAADRVLAEFSNRALTLLIPGLLGLQATGIFDAADRFRSTLSLTISIGIASVMPSFARGFEQSDDQRAELIGHTVKYTTLLMGLVAFALCIFAEPLILLLFGEAFRGSILPMQILAWAQVLVSADAMLKQAMVAGSHQDVVPKISLAGLVVLAVLVVALALAQGTIGVAVAVVIGAAFTMSADLAYTTRRVVRIDVTESVIKPVICLGATAAVLFLLLDSPLWQRTAAALATLVVTGALTRVLPRPERSFLWTLVTRPRAGKAST